MTNEPAVDSQDVGNPMTERRVPFTAKTGSRGRWRMRRVLGVIVGILITYWAITSWRLEILRWKVAAIEADYVGGKKEKALNELKELRKQHPESPLILRRLISWRKGEKDHEGALIDCERLVELYPTDLNMRLVHAELLLDLGRFADSIQTCLEFLETPAASDSQLRAIALNSVAYGRAIANTDIDKGLDEIDQALRLVGENYSMIDTRGFLYFRQGDLPRARMDFDVAVRLAESEIDPLLLLPSQGDSSGTVGSGETPAIVESNRRSLAVIRYHRSLVLRLLKEDAAAEEDEAWVRRLGFDLSESLY